MKPNPVHRLPAPLEAAVQRIKLAARDAAERTIESLGLAALASTNAFQRDGLLGAQFELNRKSAIFALTFNDAFDDCVLRELAPPAPGTPSAAAAVPAAGSTDWAAFSLVEDKEVEAQISAERFGMEIAHACEWELRELDGYVASLLGSRSGVDRGAERAGERERNPLRPDLVGTAMIRGIEATSERPEIRKVLSTEFSRSLGALLPATYAAIVADMRGAGVQPLGLALRSRVSAGGAASTGGGGSEFGDSSAHGGLPPGAMPPVGRAGGFAHSQGGRGSVSGGFAPSAHGVAAHGGRGGALGHVDPALMTLIRRLAHTGVGHLGGSDAGWASDFGPGGIAQPLPPNVIRAHREELRQASRGTLDHMVIDVIGFLFDQILADAKVPPQMARQIARLQLPVLRAALGDPTFFSSRRHPVRRFVNRIASLGAAFEDFDDDGARDFLAKVRGLVSEVVEGDFEQIEPYEQKLAALEQLAAEIAARDVQRASGDAAALLSEKEDQQRLRALYAQRLSSELKDLDAPAFLREFIASVWSQVLLRAAEQGGADGPLAQRLRNVGRELYLSVQPKPGPAQRKQFLAELPRLMQELTEGMNLIRWPEDQRRAFFGQLMPAHAEALKSTAARTMLDLNLMARKVEGALQRPLPSRADVRALPPAALPVLTDEVIVPAFSADEAQRVGLVAESAVDWNGQVDIDLGAPPDVEPLAPEAEAALPALPGLATGSSAAEPAEPTEGRDLAQHVQLGYPYRMNIDGEWHKVKLSHVSPARTFFIFTHGSKHKKTVSLTQRMLVKLCEAGRLKAFESAYLIERATARARRQLAALGSAA